MIKIFINISILLLVTLGFVYLADTYIEKYDEWDLILESKEFGLLKKAQYVSFGHSQSKRMKWGFPDSAKKTISSLAMDGDDIFLQYEKMNAIRSDLRGKTVFVGTTIASFVTLGDTMDSDLPENMRMFYFKMPLRHVSYSNLSKVFKSRFYAVNNMKMLNKVMKHAPYTSDSYKVKTYKSIQDDIGANHQKIKIGKVLKKYPALPDSIRKEILKMKALSEAEHFRLIFYAFPMYKHYYEIMGDRFADSISNLMTNFFRANNIEYYNYMRDSFFIDNYDYFQDDMHLNKLGASLSVKKILDACNKTSPLQASPANKK